MRSTRYQIAALLTVVATAMIIRRPQTQHALQKAQETSGQQ